MTRTLILYTGSCEAGDVADEHLKHWSETQPNINV